MMPIRPDDARPDRADEDLKRDFRGFDAVYRSYLSEPRPVRTTVGSSLMDILVEIDLIAHRG